MGHQELQGRADFQDRIARIRPDPHPEQGNGLLRETHPPLSASKPTGESEQDLKDRIQATLATTPSATGEGRPGKRLFGLPLVVGTVGLLFVVFFLRQPVEEVSSVLEPRSNGVFPAFGDLQPNSSGYAGSKTVTARTTPDP